MTVLCPSVDNVNCVFNSYLSATTTAYCISVYFISFIVFYCSLLHLSSATVRGALQTPLIDYSMDRWHHIKVGLTSPCKSFGVVINTSMTGCGSLSPRRRRRRLFVARSVVLEAPSGESSSTISPSSSSVSSLTSSLTSSSTSDSLNSLSLSSVAASTFTCVWKQHNYTELC